MSSGLMILIAGPYRSGTGDDAAKMAQNVRAMEAYALPLFRAGHVPVVGEWLALPLTGLAGSRLADLDLLPRQNFGTAGFVETDGMRHGKAPWGWDEEGKNGAAVQVSTMT